MSEGVICRVAITQDTCIRAARTNHVNSTVAMTTDHVHLVSQQRSSGVVDNGQHVADQRLRIGQSREKVGVQVF